MTATTVAEMAPDQNPRPALRPIAAATHTDAAVVMPRTLPLMLDDHPAADEPDPGGDVRRDAGDVDLDVRGARSVMNESNAPTEATPNRAAPVASSRCVRNPAS